MQKRDSSYNKLPRISANDSTLSSKLYNLTGLRIFQAKFMEDLRNPRPQTKLQEGFKATNENFTQTLSTKPIVIEPFTGKDKTNENKQEKQKEISSIIKTKQEKTLKIPERIRILNGRPKGFKNLGNTCYLNAVLQSLLALEEFNFALEKQIKLKKAQKTLANTYNKLANCYRTCGQNDILNPSDFKSYMGKRKDRFSGNSQQDAQQCLTAFLQVINEQMSRVKTKAKYRQLHGDPTKDTLKNIADQWWNYFKEKDDSVVCDYFQGQIQSTVTCSSCNFQSVSFDNFWGLPVTLRQKGNNSNLTQLIAQNFSTESRLEDYCCQRCKKSRTCSKKVRIFRLPIVLVVQIKRFVYGSRKHKIKDRITIPTDLSLKEVISKESNQKQTNYILKSTIEHSGQLNFGHYTGHVYSEKQQKWYCADDDIIQQQNVSKDCPQLYVLFYYKK